MVARLQHIAAILAHERADGHAIAKSLGGCHHVRLNIEALIAPEATEPPHAGLHFVEYQQDIVLVAPLSQPLQVALGRHIDATLALQDFDHNGAGLICGRLAYRVQVLVGHIRIALRERQPCLLIRGLARSCDHAERATMERVEHGDDVLRAVAVQPSVLARQLDRALVCLHATVGEEHLVHATVLDEGFGKLKLRNSVEQVGGLHQRGCLLLNRLCDGRMAMTQVVHRQAGREVKVFLAFRIPYTHTFTALYNHRLTVESVNVVLTFFLFPFCC